MSSALFGSAARASSKNLVEFRAGKMHLKGKIVHPDKRKGLLFIYQSDDSLMHFCWKDRTTGSVEEDLIIFPDDVDYRRCSACTTGRVYVLRFRSTNRRIFFWMQEPKTEKDDEYCRKVNELLNNPPTPGSHSASSRSGGGVSSGGGGSGSSNMLNNLRDADLANIIGNISQQQLMQILGSGVPNLSSLVAPTSGSRSSNTTSVTPTTASTPTTATTPPPATTTASSAGQGTGGESSPAAASSSSSDKQGPIQLADLKNILSGMMGDKSPAGVDLSPAMTAEALKPILSNPDFVEQLRPLLPPTSDPLPPADQLRGTVTSPQFKQAVSVFSHALQSGQLGPLVKQFGLGDEAVVAAVAADMEAFILALGKNNKEDGSGEKQDNKTTDDDDDDKMAVD